MNRRNLLKAGSSLSLPILAGCSGPSEKTSSNDTVATSTEDSTERPLKPEPVEEYALPAAHTVAEWRGTLELNEEQSHWKREISRSDDRNNPGRCFFLECEIEADTSLSDNEQVNLFLIPGDEGINFEELTNVEDCRTVVGQEVCNPNTDAYNRNKVLGEIIELEPGKSSYVRYLLSDAAYHVVIDGADTLGGRFLNKDFTRSISQADLDVKIRVVDNQSERARSEVVNSFDGWLTELSSGSSEKTVSDAQSFADEICDSEDVASLSTESVEDLATDIDQLQDYLPVISGLLQSVNKHYSMGLSSEFTNWLENMVRWGSTAMPVVTSIITVAEKACLLADSDNRTSEEVKERRAKELLLSLAGLAVEVIFIKWGIVSRVSRTAIEIGETFVFGYIREIAGLRLFAYLFKSLALQLEDGLFTTITEFANQVADELIDKDDLSLLTELASDDVDWDDLVNLDEEDYSCSNMASGDAHIVKRLQWTDEQEVIEVSS